MEATPDIVPAERAMTYLAALRRLWWLVLVTTVMAASAGFLVSSSQQKRYDASAKVLLASAGAEPVNILQRNTIPNPQDPERDLNTDTALVKLDSIARDVRARLNLPLSSTQLLREVSAAPAGTSSLIEIKARDAKPARAAAIANAFAREYIDVRRVEAQAPYKTAAAQAQRQLAELGPGQTAKAIALRQQLHDLQVAGALQTGGAQVVDAATAPTSAATPRPKFAAAVAAIIGLLVGALVAIAIGQRPSPASLRLLRADDHESAESSTNGSAGLSEEEAASHVRAAEKAHPVPTEEAEPPPVRVSRYTDS